MEQNDYYRCWQASEALRTEQAMNTNIDDSHDAALKSWLESANDPATDFPIQNLPFGRFRRAARHGLAYRRGDRRPGAGPAPREGLIDTYDMNRLMRL